MSKSVKRWLIAAALLVMSGCAVFAGAMAALGFDFSKISTVKYETNTYEVSGDFDKISIDVDITDIAFEKSDDESCKVVCYEEEKVKHSVRCTNGTLIIDMTDDRKWYDYIGISFESPKMTVYLPQSEYISLSIETDTGNIDIPESFVFDKIEINTDTGNTDCKAYVSDNIGIESNTGNIGISSVGSGCDIDVKTDTGTINLEDISCMDLTAESDTGNISLKNVSAVKCISVESDTGNVKLKNSDAAELSIDTDTGNVTGTLLSEKIFIARSHTGNVNVPETQTGGKCEIITDTGNIKIDIK